MEDWGRGRGEGGCYGEDDEGEGSGYIGEMQGKDVSHIKTNRTQFIPLQKEGRGEHGKWGLRVAGHRSCACIR